MWLYLNAMHRPFWLVILALALAPLMAGCAPQEDPEIQEESDTQPATRKSATSKPVSVAKVDTTWVRLALREADPGLIMRDGESWPRSVGFPLYDHTALPSALDSMRRSSLVHSVPASLADTLSMAAVVSKAPDNAIRVLAGRADAGAPWRIYLDQDADNAFSEDEYLFTAKSADDNDGRPHKAASGAAIAQYHALEDGEVVHREVPTEIIWVENNRGVASTQRHDQPLFLFNAVAMLREGHLAIGDTSYRFALRKPRDGYYPSFQTYHEVLVDRDGNGRFDVSKGSPERHDHGDAFPLGGARWTVAEVASGGEWVQLRSVSTPEHKQAAPVSSQQGETAPAWSGTTLDGERLRSSELGGRYVLLDFWASWCSPCIREIPNLRRVSERYPSDRLAVIGIATQDKEQAVRSAAERHGIAWPVVLDLGEEIASSFNVLGLPDPVLVGPENRVLERGDALRGKQLSETLKRYVGAP